MDPTDLQERLDADLHRLAADAEVPGVSVAVAFGPHRAVATSGVVNTRTQVAVTPDTLFPIQSVTKVLTATLVLQLVDDNLVELDRPVRAYLPEFRTADEDASGRITVRHLLTHTGGFEGDLWQPTTSGPDALDRFVRDLVSRAPQHSAPGERFSYCNAGFGTLGRLVEVMRGTTYEQALRRHLAGPLGVEELAFDADQALAFRTAIGHVRPTPGAPLRPTRRWALMPPSNPAAGNQLAMSARGLLDVARLFLAQGDAQVLTPSTATLMMQPQLEHQGLGWALPRPGVAAHGGGAPGIASLLAVVPEHELAVAVLTNADAGGTLAGNLLDSLLADLTGLEPQPPLPTPDPSARPDDPTPYVGAYASRQFTYEVTRDDGGRLWLTSGTRNEGAAMNELAGTVPAADRKELRPLADATFAVIGEAGRTTRTITFLDPAPDGRFRLLATSRVAVREVSRG